MSNDIKFSIVIPVYNNRKYLAKCLKSVIKQTYDNYEAIVIDDGSTDGSSDLLDKFASEYPEIKVVHQSNCGVSASRVKAVNLATGDYITFLDSDDWYSPDFLYCMYSKIVAENCSIVQVGYYNVYQFYKKICNCNSGTIYNNAETIIDFIGGLGKITYGPCDKAFRRDIISKAINESDKSLIFGEDAYVNLVLLCQNPDIKISFIDKPLYYYRQGSGICASKDRAKVYSLTMKANAAMYSYAKEHLNDNGIFKKFFIESAFATRYFSLVLTKNIKNSDICIKLLSDKIFSNNDIQFFIKEFSDESFSSTECIELLKNNAETYYDYIKKCQDEDKKNETVVLKIKKVIYKLLFR